AQEEQRLREEAPLDGQAPERSRQTYLMPPLQGWLQIPRVNFEVDVDEHDRGGAREGWTGTRPAPVREDVGRADPGRARHAQPLGGRDRGRLEGPEERLPGDEEPLRDTGSPRAGLLGRAVGAGSAGGPAAVPGYAEAVPTA